LDLYVCGYVQYRYDPANVRAKTQQYASLVPASLNPSTYKPERNLLYRNNGDGTFTEVARSAGVENVAGRSLSASWGDFDGDRWPDLYVANDVSDNAMFRNRGDGTFEDVSHSAHVADYRGAMGLAVGDWDGDEDLDIFITHWIAQENALYNNLKAEFAQTGQAGKGMRFVDVADRFGLGQVALDYVGWGAAFADYDNDGRPDLFVVDGSTFQREDDPSLLVPMRGLLFWNRGPQEGFFEVGAVSGEVFRREVVGRGLAVGDYDNDGDPDAFVVVNGGAGMLLRNDGSTGLTTGGGDRNRWLKVRLVGGKRPETEKGETEKRGESLFPGSPAPRFSGSALSNRDGIGAKIKVVAGDLTQVAQVRSGTSYLSQSDLRAHFGLGGRARVDLVEVRWPSGRVDRVRGVPADRKITLREGER
ncbi:CRTAC1 family protein, partial [bacterium]|nr:CRTAC1 family protein [bacterium]